MKTEKFVIFWRFVSLVGMQQLLTNKYSLSTIYKKSTRKLKLPSTSALGGF